MGIPSVFRLNQLSHSTTHLGICYESNVLSPDIARLPVHSALLECKLVRLGDDPPLGLFFWRAQAEWVLPPDVVKVRLPDVDVCRGGDAAGWTFEGLAEEGFDVGKVGQGGFEIDEGEEGL